MSMKNFLFSLFALLCSVVTLAQNSNPLPDVRQSLCDYSTEQAIIDFTDEKYVLVTYGLVVSQDWDFDAFSMNYMAKTHNIKMSYGGCMVLPSELCYTNKMKALLHEKFGDDFFDKTKKEAKKLYLSK